MYQWRNAVKIHTHRQTDRHRHRHRHTHTYIYIYIYIYENILIWKNTSSEDNLIHSLNCLPMKNVLVFKPSKGLYEFLNETKNRESFKHSISVGGVLFQIYVIQSVFENLF